VPVRRLADTAAPIVRHASVVCGPHTVIAVLAHTDPVVEYLRLDTGAIDTTSNHSFFAAYRGWLLASSLTAGDLIRTESGDHAAIVQFRVLTIDEARERANES
jgi:hypothetical protein